MTSSVHAEQLKQARDYISVKLGIHFPAGRLAELDKKLKELEKDWKLTSQQDFIKMLVAGRLNKDQIHTLVGSLTIGETYFFRELATIEALGTVIMPNIARQRGRSLRIWCAGCATGEEPYSIAMYLAEQPHLANWHVSIIATDINPAFLERARKGEYTKWSFRTTPDHYKNSYFNKISDNLYEVKETIRRTVKFVRLNLAETDYSSLLTISEGLDVIFCRNVLMYFSPDSIRSIIGRFADALAPDGFLIVSQTECSDYFSAAFETVQHDGSFFYRKKNANAPVVPQSVPKSKIRSHDALKTGKSLIQTRPIQSLHEVPSKIGTLKKQITEHTLTQSHSGEHLFAKAEKLANRGFLADACALCEQGIACDNLNLHGHYLHATILQESGNLPEAVSAIKKALYLEPDFVMGYYTLGIIEQKLGNTRQALRNFDNMAKLLTLYKDEDIVPESTGISAGHMRELLYTMRKKNALE